VEEDEQRCQLEFESWQTVSTLLVEVSVTETQFSLARA
jgi:hypothetical protein